MAEMELAAGMQDQEMAAGAAQNAKEASEKMVPQSEVNRIVGSQKAEAYERGKQEALAQLQAQQASQQQQAQMSQAPQGEGSMGGMQQVSQDEIRRMIAEEHERSSNMAQANQIAYEFTQKMDAGNAKYPDFQEVVGKLDLSKVPHLVQMSNQYPNTADVIYDIAKNPMKLAQLQILYHTSPQLAQSEISKLANSIKANQSADFVPSVDEPLSQIKPYTIGTDNGTKTVTDWRSKSYLRG